MSLFLQLVLPLAVAAQDLDGDSIPDATDPLTRVASNVTLPPGSYQFQHLQLASGATLTALGDTTTTEFPGVTVLAKELTIDAGASFSASGQGHPVEQGPGAGPQGHYVASGAGHGGKGGSSTTDVDTGGISYGSAITPSELGSGGGRSSYYWHYPATAGGGAIQLDVLGTLTINGEVSANGETPQTPSCGGGSGGSIFIRTGAFAGDGSIAADGSASSNCGGGGGGRILIRYGASSFSGTVHANGAPGYPLPGKPGTVGLVDTSVNDFFAGVSWQFQAADSPFNFRNVLLDRSNVAVENTVQINAHLFSVVNNSTVAVAGRTEIHSQQTVLDAGSRITADGGGYPMQTGPGRGMDGNYAADGGGHGGNGGNVTLQGGGLRHGSAAHPADFGSGGGRTYASPGAAGGGSIRLIASQRLVLDGNISANGQIQPGLGGGGAGGSIWITAGDVSGDSSITANGSNGGSGSSSGGGGGGRIAVYYANTTFSGITETNGGSGSVSGGQGTVGFFDTTTDTFSPGQSWRFQENDGDVDVDNLLVSDSQVIVEPGVRLVVRGSFSLSGGTTFETLGDVASVYAGTVSLSDGSVISGNIRLVADQLTIGPTSLISADAAGFGPHSGPGAGQTGLYHGSGAGHGGAGGTSTAAGLAGGNPYDSESEPVQRGSGGGGNGYYATLGGPGGGALRLIVYETFANNGGVSSNAGVSQNGGGSGGSIYVTAKTLTGTGVFTANGADAGEPYSAGGGGGRIAVYHQQSTFGGTMTAAPGNGELPGSHGTVVYLGDAPNSVTGQSGSNQTVRSLVATITVEHALLSAGTLRNESSGVAGSLEISDFRLVQLSTGSFSRQGFLDAIVNAQIDGLAHAGTLQGQALYDAPSRQYILHGALSGDINGTFEGVLKEITPANNVFDALTANLKVRLADTGAAVELTASGTLSSISVESFPDADIGVSVDSFDGKSVGDYSGPLSVVMTSVTVTDAATPVDGRGFALVSTGSEVGPGVGWFYTEADTSAVTSLSGMLSEPLFGTAFGSIDRSSTTPLLDLALKGIDPSAQQSAVQTTVIGARSASPGQTINYTIQYRNEGNVPAQDLEIFFSPPFSTTFSSGTAGVFFDSAIHKAMFKLPDLAPWSQGEIQVNMTSNWGLVQGKSLKAGVVAVASSQIQQAANPHLPPLTPDERDMADALFATMTCGAPLPAEYQSLRVFPANVTNALRTYLNHMWVAGQVGRNDQAKCYASYLSAGLQGNSGFVPGKLGMHLGTLTIGNGVPYPQGLHPAAFQIQVEGAMINQNNNSSHSGDPHLYGFYNTDPAVHQAIMAQFLLYQNGQLNPSTVPAGYHYYDSATAFEQSITPEGSVQTDAHIHNYNPVTGQFTLSVTTTIQHPTLGTQTLTYSSLTDFDRFNHGDVQAVANQITTALNDIYLAAYNKPNELQQHDISFEELVNRAEVACGTGSCKNSPDAQTPNKFTAKGGFKSIPYTGSSTGACPLCYGYETIILAAHDPNAKSGTEGPLSAGQRLTYKVEYANEGDGTAYGVYVTDVLSNQFDDSTLTVGAVFDGETNQQVAEAGSYNPLTRTIAWNIGELPPKAGGYAEVGINLRDDALPGAIVANHATVYFPSVPEITPTNTVLAYIPFPITANAGDNGSIEPAGVIPVQPAASQQFSLRPADGYVVDRVLVDGIERPFADSAITLSRVCATQTVAVWFRSADADGDGIPDAAEIAMQLDQTVPNHAALDSDGDGLSNLEEYRLGSLPFFSDTDGDGIGNNADPDDDNDGRPDVGDNCPRTPNVSQSDEDTDGLGDACDPDDDNDGIPDLVETAWGLDPLDGGDGRADADRDGESNAAEHADGTDPYYPDNGAGLAPSALAYVPVEPCRIVDTRASTAGPLPPDVVGVDGDARSFLVSGDAATLAVQGGATTGCLHPKADEGLEPAAIAAYLIGVPAPGSAGGVLSAFPADQPDPAPGTGSTVNFAAGQVVGNTTIVTLCAPGSCPADGQFAVLARNTSQHVVVDVQGYFYPKEVENLITVSAAGGDYTSPLAALGALQALVDANDPAKPSATHPYQIQIGPGVYELGTQRLRLLPHVSIQGAGRGLTHLHGLGGAAPDQGVVQGANASHLADLRVDASGGAYAIALYNDAAAPTLERVRASASGGITNYAIRNTNGALPSISHSRFQASGGSTSVALVNDAGAGVWLSRTHLSASAAATNRALQGCATCTATATMSTLAGHIANQAATPIAFIGSLLGGTITGPAACFGSFNSLFVPLGGNCLPLAPAP